MIPTVADLRREAVDWYWWGERLPGGAGRWTYGGGHKTRPGARVRVVEYPDGWFVIGDPDGPMPLADWLRTRAYA